MTSSIMRFSLFFKFSKFFSILKSFRYYFQAMPAGPLSAKRYGLSHPDDGCYWVRADPVKLLADHQQVFMRGYSGVELQKDQVESIIAKLNNLLAQDELEIIYLTSTQWLLKCKPGSFVVSNINNINYKNNTVWYSVTETLNKNINLFLPTGTNQSYWRRLFTECQMIMQDNENNSLWFWGGGVSQ